MDFFSLATNLEHNKTFTVAVEIKNIIIKGTSKHQTLTGSIILPRGEVEGFRLVGFQPTPKFTIDVLPNKLLGYQGILGMDYISKFETWISRSRGQLFVTGIGIYWLAQ